MFSSSDYLIVIKRMSWCMCRVETYTTMIFFTKLQTNTQTIDLCTLSKKGSLVPKQRNFRMHPNYSSSSQAKIAWQRCYLNHTTTTSVLIILVFVLSFDVEVMLYLSRLLLKIAQNHTTTLLNP